MKTVSKPPRPFILDQNDHLKLIGAIAIALPLLLYLQAKLICHCGLQESISHYYYTVSGDLFVGMMCAIGTFMILYRGYEGKDQIATNIAGFFAMAIALFPTSNNTDIACKIFEYPDNTYRVIFHYGSAAALFLILAYMCLFIFTLSDKEVIDQTENKKYRNRFYRLFGIVIIFCVISIFLFNKIPAINHVFPDNYTFWAEWTATYSFGIAWLMKGGIILKD